MIGLFTSLMFQNELFEHASSGITSFNMIVEFGSSNIVTESVNYEVTNLVSSLFYRNKEVEQINETRTRQYNELKTN